MSRGGGPEVIQYASRGVDAERTVDLELGLADELVAGALVGKFRREAPVVAQILGLVAGVHELQFDVSLRYTFRFRPNHSRSSEGWHDAFVVGSLLDRGHQHAHIPAPLIMPFFPLGLSYSRLTQRVRLGDPTGSRV